MKELKIVYLPPGELTPYQKNAKKHPDVQIEQIANSIRRYGFKQPIVIDRDNVIIIGHGRLLAAERLGLDAVPVVRADDLTEYQVRELRIVDNKTAESPWDYEVLRRDIADLGFDGFDFGFDDIPDTDGKKQTQHAHETVESVVCPRCGHVFEEDE